MIFDPAVVADVVKSQPELFAVGPSESELVEPGLIQIARDFSDAPRHTGRTATRDEARCVAAFAMLSAGVSRREIAKRLSMGRHTLDAIEAAFERGGKLAPLKERVQRQLALVVSDAIEAMRDTFAGEQKDIETAAWLKAAATALGIGFDKHALATGGPTEIVEHKGPTARAAVDAFWEEALQAGVVVTDAEVVTDSDSGDQPLLASGLGGQSTPLLTVGPAGQADPARSPAPPARPAEGGGGGAPRPEGGANSDDSTGSQNLSQGGQT